MREDNYTKRETDLIIRRIDENIQEGFAQVNAHLKTLNGQVASNTTWRNKSLGALAVVTAIIIPVLILIIKMYVGN